MSFISPPSALQRALIAVVLGCHVLAPSPALVAQEREGGRPESSTPHDHNKGGGLEADLKTGREAERSLDRAATLFRRSEFRAGIQLLQSLLDQPITSLRHSDSKEAKQRTFRLHTVKDEAEALIAKLPPSSHRLYQVLYGQTAQQMLSEAERSHDLAMLGEVARRFFHTQAGQEAAFHLASVHLDRSESLSAVLWFERLRGQAEARRRFEPMLSLKTAVSCQIAGLPELGQSVLEDAVKSAMDREISLAGKQQPAWINGETAKVWLQSTCRVEPSTNVGSTEWSLFRGNLARNGTSPPANPIPDAVWKVCTSAERLSYNPWSLGGHLAVQELVASQLGQPINGLETAISPLSPAVHPIVMNGRVVCRTFAGLEAIDLTTGESLWQTATNDPTLAEISRQIQGVSNRHRVGPHRLLKRYLNQRWFLDLTSGTLSSDGHLVFSLEECGLLEFDHLISATRTQQDLYFDCTNVLRAYELDTGRLRWERGGRRGGPELPLAGEFFLAPPLPSNRWLYCLTYETDETRLMVLDGLTGRLAWMVSLGEYDPGPLPDLKSKCTGNGPSLSDGVLLCPVSAGAVVAVDCSLRRPMWCYRYRIPRTYDASDPRTAMMYAVAQSRSESQLMETRKHWADGVPTVSRGCAILTPVDSDELHCVRLHDGKLLWKQPRDDGLYVATLFEDRVVVVADTRIRAYRLSDGTPAWDQDIPIPAPAGRGFRSEGRYHLPLSTGAVLTVDLATGRILARSKSHLGDVPGNLVATHGTVISQTAESISAFRPLPVLEQTLDKQLTRDPDDAAALALRGELHLHLGNVQRGLEDLRRSMRLHPTDEARNVLLTRLLDDLRFDFEAHRSAMSEIASLVQDPEQRTAFLKLQAEGLSKAGQTEEAFWAFLDLIDQSDLDDAIASPDGRLFARRDCWVRPRLKTVYDSASAEQRTRLDEEISRRLESAQSSEGSIGLRNLMSVFDWHRVSSAARRTLVERLSGVDQRLELELQLGRLRTESDPNLAAFATARLSQVLAQSNRQDLSAELLNDLSTQWADVVCLDGKTGSEVVTELSQALEMSEFTDPRLEWPRETIQAKLVPKGQLLDRKFAVPLDGQAESLMGGWTLEVQMRHQLLLARDSLGQVRWMLPLAATTLTLPGQGPHFASAMGPLLLLALGERFVVLNMASTKSVPSEESEAEVAAAIGGQPPHLLWSRELHELSAPVGSEYFVQGRPVLRPGGGHRFLMADTLGRSVGMVTVVSDEVLCYQVGTDLYAANWLDGEILWKRRNVPRGTEFFGDAEQVVLIDPTTGMVTFLRTADGERIDEKPFPSGVRRLSTTGRFLLTWQPQDERYELAKYDLQNDRPVWQREFSDRAIVEPLGTDEIAVIDRQGLFTIVRIADGEELIQCKVPPVPDAVRAFVLRSRDCYVLLTSSPVKTSELRISGLTQDPSHPVINGRADGIARQSGLRLWSTPIEKMAVDLTQPQDLPILVFATKYQQLSRQGNVKNEASSPKDRFVVSVLDKRTGEMIFRDDAHPQTEVCRVVAAVDRKSVRVLTHGATVELTFTGEPLDSP